MLAHNQPCFLVGVHRVWFEDEDGIKTLYVRYSTSDVSSSKGTHLVIVVPCIKRELIMFEWDQVKYKETLQRIGPLPHPTHQR
jgi:hypothetical protein